MTGYPVAELARDLGVSPGDVRTVLAWMGVASIELTPEECGAVREILDPHGERTAPAGLYWGTAAHPPPPGGMGLQGSSATHWEDGPYDWPPID